MNKKKHYRPTFVHDIKELPVKIQERVSQVLERALGELSKAELHPSIVVYDIEKQMKMVDDIAIGITPKYSISFTYVNPKDFKDQFNFGLNLDEYGQIIHLGLPLNKPDANIAALTGKQEAINQATIFANRKGYKAKVIFTWLYYSNRNYEDLLFWQIWLEQKTERIDETLFRSCRVLSIDPYCRIVYKNESGTWSKQGNCLSMMEQHIVESVDE